MAIPNIKVWEPITTVEQQPYFLAGPPVVPGQLQFSEVVKLNVSDFKKQSNCVVQSVNVGSFPAV